MIIVAPRPQYIRFIVSLICSCCALYYLIAPHANNRRPVPIVRSGFDWGSFEHYHSPKSYASLPSGQPRQLRRIQHRFSRTSRSLDSNNVKRRHAVKAAFQRCWRSYRELAWTRDELKPLSGGGKDTYGGWAATMIDSLDTLWIMDLKKDFYEGVEAVASLDWANTTAKEVNLFETTIRHLGGLLSAYDLSKDPVLIEKAIELGDMLYAGFDTPNRMPPFWLNFEQAKMGQLVADSHEPSATPGSLSMEFTRLSQLTGDPKYYDAISRITDLLVHNQNQTKLPGMFPMFFNMERGIVTEDNSFSLGALSDSIYEYFPKMYALLGGLESVYETLYRESMETVTKYLLFRPMTPDDEDILFAGTVHVDPGIRLDTAGQHLTCFAGGMSALGGRLFDIQEHVEIGARLARGCAWAYKAFPSGIMPEIFGMVTCDTLAGCEWDEAKWKSEVAKDEQGHDRVPKGFRHARDPSYILRPEAIESVFLLYRMTGDETLRETAWDMFQAIQRATETPLCNAAIDDVTATQPKQRDSMESFWLAETLKYFHLIFSPPDLISLDNWVLNTEAHTFLIPKPGDVPWRVG